MLSRAATSLALLGRQLERADHLARILDVHLDLALDRASESESGFWSRLMLLAGWNGVDIDRREQAIELLAGGAAGPSVRRCVAAARSAAQAVRPSLPSELYEQLNSLYWRVEEATWERDHHGFLMAVQLGVHLVEGLIEDTMFHDEAREFVRLGKFLERIDDVVTLVSLKSDELAAVGEDSLDWTAVLKCSFAFESFRSRFPAPVTGEQVASFLLFDPALPRSATFSADQALNAIRRIDGARTRSRPARVMARISGLFHDGTAISNGIRALDGEYRELAGQLTSALRATYFQPGKVAASAPGDPSSRVPQQQ